MMSDGIKGFKFFGPEVRITMELFLRRTRVRLVMYWAKRRGDYKI